MDSLSEIDNIALSCPYCGEEYLHHGAVAVYVRRNYEDGPADAVKVGPGLRIEYVHKATGNPSSRRHGVAINMHCEICENQSVLSIAQHKGLTLLNHTPTNKPFCESENKVNEEFYPSLAAEAPTTEE